MHSIDSGGAMRVRRTWRGIVAAALVGIPLATTLGVSQAHEAHGHPARIHEGTCEALGGVAYRLNGVGGNVDLDNVPVATPAAVNPDRAYQVMVSESIIEGTLDDLLASGHAVMIYESDEELEAIACGSVGGAMSGDTLITGLAEMGVAGHLGFAHFQPEGDSLAVSLVIGHAMAPVSASGAQVEHDDAEDGHEDEAEEDGHDGEATPEA